MNIKHFYSAILSAAMLLSTATFYACNKDDDSKPDNPVNPENPKDPENPTINADELSQTIKTLAETATEGKPVTLALDASITNNDLKIVAEALNKNGSVNVSLDLSKTGITAIPASAFKDVKNLAEVVLPQNTITLDPTAFEGSAMDVLADGKLVSFKDAKFAENVCVLAHVTEIPDSAFFYVLKDKGDMNGDGRIDEEDYVYNETLKKVSFADGSKLTRIGISAFDKCSQLTDIALPDGVKIIGDYAYCLCWRCEHITLPKSVETIGDRAFFYVPMGDDFEIPSSVKEVGKSAFWWDDNEARHLSVRTIDGKAKMETIRFDIETFEVPNTWIEMPFCWMLKWGNLKSMTFQKNSHIESLPRMMISELPLFEKMEIPASVKVIEACVFFYVAPNLTVTFEKGSNVEKIDPDAFCSGWDDAFSNRTIHLPKYFELHITGLVAVSDKYTIYVPADLLEKFKAANCYKNCTLLAEE